MITKAEAKKFVYETVIESLTKKRPTITTAMISHAATQKDVKKVQDQMDELAAFLEKKLKGRKNVEVDNVDPDSDVHTRITHSSDV